jgi:hypothetical protein
MIMINNQHNNRKEIYLHILQFFKMKLNELNYNESIQEQLQNTSLSNSFSEFYIQLLFSRFQRLYAGVAAT